MHVVGADGRVLTPKDGTSVGAYAYSQQGVHRELWPMTYDRRSRAFSLVADDLPHTAARRLTITASSRADWARRTEYLDV